MNKYEEAYKRLTSKSYKYASPESVYEDLEKLKPLIEKATPKKIIEQEEYIKEIKGYADVSYCANCHEEPATG